MGVEHITYRRDVGDAYEDRMIGMGVGTMLPVRGTWLQSLMENHVSTNERRSTRMAAREECA